MSKKRVGSNNNHDSNNSDLHVIKHDKRMIDRCKDSIGKHCFYYEDGKDYVLVDNRLGKWKEYRADSLEDLLQAFERGSK